MKIKLSQRGPIGVSSPLCNRMSRSFSPTGVVPGSRHVTTSYPNDRNHSTNKLIWVDFPAPSTPSKLKNIRIRATKATSVVGWGWLCEVQFQTPSTTLDNAQQRSTDCWRHPPFSQNYQAVEVPCRRGTKARVSESSRFDHRQRSVDFRLPGAVRIAGGRLGVWWLISPADLDTPLRCSGSVPIGRFASGAFGSCCFEVISTRRC